MAKFNASSTAPTRRSQGSTPLRSVSSTPDALTHEGGQGFEQGSKTELYRLVLAGFVAEDSFYESGEDKMTRARGLIEAITDADETENRAESGAWLAGLIRWTRTVGNMRTAPVLMAAEAVRVRLARGAHGWNREIVAGSMDRADEPGEFLSYWRSMGDPRGSRTLPKPVKRGLSDAIVRLYSEYSTLRYDTGSHAVRFGDVVELAQPRVNAATPVESQNDALMRHLIDRRHGYNTNEIPESLSMLRTRAELEAVPVEQRRGILVEATREGAARDRLRAAGISWEWLAGWLQGPMDADAWTVALGNMGYMALLRNLRNFDQAGIDAVTATEVANRLSDPEQVAKSRQFPFRFLSAYKAVESDRWRGALSMALDASTSQIPALSGRTLILTDTSYSMHAPMSERSTMNRLEAAALFAVALGMRCGRDNVDVFAYADTYERLNLASRGGSVLSQVEKIEREAGKLGMGTRMAEAVRGTFDEQDRVIIFTDMQAFDSRYGSVFGQVPASVPCYAFDLSGDRVSVVPNTPNRHQLGGLTDKTFEWIPQAESGTAIGWPWERKSE